MRNLERAGTRFAIALAVMLIVGIAVGIWRGF